MIEGLSMESFAPSHDGWNRESLRIGSQKCLKLSHTSLATLVGQVCFICVLFAGAA